MSSFWWGDGKKIGLESKRNKKADEKANNLKSWTNERKIWFFERSFKQRRSSLQNRAAGQKRKKSSSCGRRKLSPPLQVPHKSFFQKARARQKWWKCVFDRWKVSSLVSHSYSHSRGRKRERDRAWCARIFCAGKGGGAFLFRFLFSRKTSYQVGYALVLEEDKERDSHE